HFLGRQDEVTGYGGLVLAGGLEVDDRGRAHRLRHDGAGFPDRVRSWNAELIDSACGSSLVAESAVKTGCIERRSGGGWRRRGGAPHRGPALRDGLLQRRGELHRI